MFFLGRACVRPRAIILPMMPHHCLCALRISSIPFSLTCFHFSLNSFPFFFPTILMYDSVPEAG